MLNIDLELWGGGEKIDGEEEKRGEREIQRKRVGREIERQSEKRKH